MLDLINVSSSYNFKKARNINQSLIFYKNILMLMSKKGFKQHKDNVVFPVRWSRAKDTWVVDFRTQKERDVSGIELNNLRLFYPESSVTNKLINSILEIFNMSRNDKFWDKINIKKNETKFIAITCNTKLENVIFHIEGIYSFSEYKHRPGKMSLNGCRSSLIDNSIETLLLVYNVLNSSKIRTHKMLMNKSYYREYEKFSNSLFENKHTFSVCNSSEVLNMHDYLNVSYKNIYSYKEASKIFCLKSSKKHIKFEGLIPYIIHDSFYSFLVDEFDLTSNVFIYDKLIEKNIKISKLEYNNSEKDEKEEKSNNSLLLPMVY